MQLPVDRRSGKLIGSKKEIQSEHGLTLGYGTAVKAMLDIHSMVYTVISGSGRPNGAIETYQRKPSSIAGLPRSSRRSKTQERQAVVTPSRESPSFKVIIAIN